MYKIPKIGLGTYLLENTQKSVIEAIKMGYRLIDTASAYDNEEEIGKAINYCVKEGIVSRSELFIITKLWNDEKEKPEESLKRSLKKLDLNYIDLYLIHFPIGKVENGKLIKQYPLHITWKFLEKCVENSLTKYIGVCNFNVQLLLDLLSYAKIPPLVNQVELHPFFQQNDLIEFCHNNSINVIGYNPLLRGASTRKRIDFGQIDLFTSPIIIELSKKYGMTAAQIILSWHISKGIIPIPKSSDTDRQLENLKSLENNIDEGDIKLINKMDKGIRFNISKNKPYCAGINLWA